MGKLIFILVLVGLGIYMVHLGIQYGKSLSKPAKAETPASKLDRRIQELRDEIEKRMSDNPEEILRNQEKVAHLEAELARAKSLKEKFEL